MLVGLQVRVRQIMNEVSIIHSRSHGDREVREENCREYGWKFWRVREMSKPLRERKRESAVQRAGGRAFQAKPEALCGAVRE